MDSYGVQGPPGPPGVCSCNMSHLLASFVMPDLISGPPGEPGRDGKAGPPGPAVSYFYII